ncbi:hypothetical protein AYI68_g7512 [Smittium mucronatum]|uniref:Uncharacterized protein n=1 Tax=Smittium mucronatum TaxID=133383 RepID=A0A1R0GNG4_9FUNG|nr:hypothetical protein AYI68_g7512 [Smittium mucronatum]
MDISLCSEVSAKQMLHEGDQRFLKIFCIGGLDRKLGCSWSQFRGNHNDRIEYVTKFISDINHMRKDDHRTKDTYFIFDFDSDSSDFMSKKLVFADWKVDLYQTFRMDQDLAIININNFMDDGIFVMVKLIDKEISPLGTICDISAWCKKSAYEYLTFGMKVF